jgi:hypothetical protein
VTVTTSSFLGAAEATLAKATRPRVQARMVEGSFMEGFNKDEANVAADQKYSPDSRPMPTTDERR